MDKLHLKLMLLVCMMQQTACQSYPFDFVPPFQSVQTHQTLQITQGKNTDILFVIDNSHSMQLNHNNLVNNATAFINTLATSTNLYHLGVVSTDLFNVTQTGKLQSTGLITDHFFTAPSATDPNKDLIIQQIISSFQQTVQNLGIQGNLNEASLNAVLYALNPSDPNTLAWNSGFLRDDANLAIIIVTDEDDCSFKANYTNTVATWTDDVTCYQQLDILLDANSFVDAFISLKGGDVSKIRVGYIGGVMPDSTSNLGFSARACTTSTSGIATDTCGCWFYSTENYFCSSIHDEFNQPCQSTSASCPNNTTCISNPSIGMCDTTCCLATPGKRYIDFLEAFKRARLSSGSSGGVVLGSICDADYHASMLAIAQDIISSNCFSLPNPAVPNDEVQITLQRLVTIDSNTLGPVEIIPQFDPNNTTSTSTICNNCNDCTNGAWTRSTDNSSICTTCGLYPQYGDIYTIDGSAN